MFSTAEEPQWFSYNIDWNLHRHALPGYRYQKCKCFISEGRHIKYFVEETKVSFFQLCNIKNIRRWKSILFKFSFLLGLHLVFSLNICSWIYNVFSLILRKANSEENFTDNILEWLDQNITGKRTNRIKTFKHMYILLPFLHRFLMILVGRISLNIKTFHLRDHFLYSH